MGFCKNIYHIDYNYNYDYNYLCDIKEDRLIIHQPRTFNNQKILKQNFQLFVLNIKALLTSPLMLIFITHMLLVLILLFFP